MKLGPSSTGQAANATTQIQHPASTVLDAAMGLLVPGTSGVQNRHQPCNQVRLSRTSEEKCYCPRLTGMHAMLDATTALASGMSQAFATRMREQGHGMPHTLRTASKLQPRSHTRLACVLAHSRLCDPFNALVLLKVAVVSKRADPTFPAQRSQRSRLTPQPRMTKVTSVSLTADRDCELIAELFRFSQAYSQAYSWMLWVRPAEALQQSNQFGAGWDL